MSRQRNIELRHELDIGRQIIDPRSAGEKFAEWLSEPGNFLMVVVPSALAVIVLPVLAIVILPFIAGVTLAHVTYKSLLPIRYPKGSEDADGKPGEGIMFVGSSDSSSAYDNWKELWLSDNDLRMHMLILGSTGSGKSEALKTLFYNALCWSSGFFCADGKADNKLPTDVYTMLRSLGRDYDILYLNFLLAGLTPEQARRSRRRRSNKLNPFSSADADTIIQMGANLLPKVEGDAKNWQEKALNYWRSVVTALCYKRDTQGMDLSVATFIDYMALPKAEELYIEGYEESLANNGEWSYGFVGIKNYLESGCPAYQVAKLLKKHGYGEEEIAQGQFGAINRGGARGKGGKETEQDSMAFEQHSYRTNQLIPVLNLLDKTYGFIFRDKYPEIDMNDVTLRNRVLVMLIPSLEKSAAEAENLGKLAIACLRVMMSKNLGSELEGDHEELLGSKATNSPYPFLVALDELGYYFSDGLAVMFAQARSLGCSMVAAAQDLEKLTEGSRAAEAGAMFANQVTKFFLRIDDTGKTAEMVQKVVGKATVAVRRTFKLAEVGYRRSSDVDVVQEDRVSAQRLQRFKQGEGIVNALGRTTFMRWFYMGDDVKEHAVDAYSVNRFLQVAPPSEEDVIAYSVAVDEVHDPYRKGQDLERILRQERSVQLAVPFDPVLDEVGRAAMNLSQYASSETRAVALYVAMRAALERMEASPPETATADAPRAAQPAREGVQAPQAAHPASRIVPDQQATGEAEPLTLEGAEDDALAFLREQPFERKPADALLGALDLPPPQPDPLESLADPLAALSRAGEQGSSALSFSDSALRGKVLAKVIGAPGEAYDEDTGLSLMPREEDWIRHGVLGAVQQVVRPRTSDNTVVGLTQETLGNIEKVEALLDSPNPQAAARTMEHVVVNHVTPDTAPTPGTDDRAEIDTFFDELSSRLPPLAGPN